MIVISFIGDGTILVMIAIYLNCKSMHPSYFIELQRL